MAGWPYSRNGAGALNSSSQNAGRSGIGLEKRIPIGIPVNDAPPASVACELGMVGELLAVGGECAPAPD